MNLLGLFRREPAEVPAGVSETIRSFRTILVCKSGREAEMVHRLRLIRFELDKLIEYCDATIKEREKGGS